MGVLGIDIGSRALVMHYFYGLLDFVISLNVCVLAILDHCELV